MNKPLTLIIPFLAFSAPAQAADDFNFSDYTPTLDEAYTDGDTNINSGYTLEFTHGTIADHDFIYYMVNSDDNTSTPVYYKITTGVNPARNGSDYLYRQSPSAGQNLEGYFNSLTADGTSSISGGAIYNTNSMGTITGDFTNNLASAHYQNSLNSSQIYAYGGALSNISGGSISGITGDFIGNTVNSYLYTNTGYYGMKNNAYGGAVYNEGSIGDIAGNFINNYTHAYHKDTSSDTKIYAYGGAVSNSSAGSITSITGSFIGNHVYSELYGNGGYWLNSFSYGGAIYNAGIISDITGSFFGNYVSSTTNGIFGGYYSYGGAIHNEGTISSITGDFFDNHSYNYGGAISNLGDLNVTGSFVKNYSNQGGAFYNYSTGSANIAGHFIENYSSSYGGAISNLGDLNVTGNFIKNHVSLTSDAYGGAIFNEAYNKTINITGNFIQNYVEVTNASYSGYAAGGAIHNRTKIAVITGDFVGNHALASGANTQAYGGAIYNTGSIDSIAGNFIGNYVSSTANGASGGAIYEALYGNGNIGNITGNFTDNYASSVDSTASGGAIYRAEQKNLIGYFFTLYDDPSVFSDTYWYVSGNSSTVTTMNLNGNIFSGNKAVSQHGDAYGGAIFNGFSLNKTVYPSTLWSQDEYDNTLNDIENSDLYTKEEPQIEDFVVPTLVLTNVGFIGNSVKAAGEAKGGAIYNEGSINITADNYFSKFSGNKANDEHNAIYMAHLKGSQTICDLNNCTEGSIDFPTTLSLNTINGGTILFDDSIDGDAGYSVSITGDGSGVVSLNNSLVNAGSINIANSTLKLGRAVSGLGGFTSSRFTYSLDNQGGISGTAPDLAITDSTLDLNNGYVETINLKSYTISGDSYVNIDVNPDLMKSDVLSVSGDVTGSTRLVVHATSNEDIRKRGKILFAESFNDTAGSASSFSIFRVFGSPYLYDIVYTDLGDDSKTWSFAMNGSNNPDYEKGGGKIDVASEIVGYIDLHAAAVEQTRSMTRNIFNKIADNKAYCPGCGIYDINYDGNPLYNVWVSPVYHTATLKKPQNMEADIYGLEGGFDVQYNANHKLGAFASYRMGSFDLNGKGEHYNSPIKGEIDVNSYITGLYYRYDKNNFWAFAAVYGGLLQTDLSTKDGVKNDTDGRQIGGEADFGYLFALKNKYTLEPSAGISYNKTDFDEITDNFGKTAKFETLSHTEIELGLKLEKTLAQINGLAKVYIKPSIIRSYVNGNSVSITSLGKVESYKAGTLSRIELGGRYAVDKQLSIFGMTNYTFGSNYDALSLNVGLNYAW
ncbi:MAG: autotransporter outer membrane beta-barrel domain-containing protein [Lactobacillaceae bacterium]|jgi:outer membrane autotransporter protein|nr:autotransporter outer membrane beta-barrel domain-containing protein [Lactobacillaceae bacterium]